MLDVDPPFYIYSAPKRAAYEPWIAVRAEELFTPLMQNTAHPNQIYSLFANASNDNINEVGYLIAGTFKNFHTLNGRLPR